MPFLLPGGFGAITALSHSNYGEASACKTVVGPMGEIKVGPAAGAIALNKDVFGLQACIEQLPPVGFHQIQMKAWADVAMAWSACR